MESRLTIGRLARLAGVNLQTVRYYERRGLLHPLSRTTSGYRLYDDESLRRLMFIRHAKEMGFTLEEIKGLLDLSVDGTAACERVKERAERKLRAVEERIEALLCLKKVLGDLIVACRRRRPTEKCPILRIMEGDGTKRRSQRRRR